MTDRNRARHSKGARRFARALRSIPLASALLLVIHAIPANGAAGPAHDDPYAIEFDRAATPSRWDLEQLGEARGTSNMDPRTTTSRGPTVTPRLEAVLADARALGIEGMALPPHRVTSLGLTAPGARIDPAAASLEVARAHPALFGVGAEDLALASVKRGGGINYVHFRQSLGGYPVLGSHVLFQWDDAGRLRLTGSDVYQESPFGEEYGDDPGRGRGSRPAPRWIGLREARSAALDGMPADLAVTEWEHAEQAWLPVARGEGSGLDLVAVWNIRFRCEEPVGWYDVVIDGETGALLSRTNRVHFEELAGSVQGVIEPNEPGDAYETRGMPEAYATLRGGGADIPLVTDRDGRLEADVPPGVYQLEARLAGERIFVQNYLFGGRIPAGQVEVSIPDPAGDPDAPTFFWDPTNSEDSDRDAYYHGNLAYQAIRAIDSTPGLVKLDTPMQTVVDDNTGICNAYWNGTRMNFYAAGGPCVATSRIADVVYHEYGHAVTQFTYEPFFAPSDMHEGFSDYLAATMRDDPVVGRGFRGPGTILRNIETDRVYPDDVHSDPHITGLIIAGALWDLRKELGKERTDHLWHFARYAAAQTFDDFLVDMLVLDDDDADLGNGTPNQGAIVGNFRAHGIGDYVVALSNAVLPDVEEPGALIDVSVKVFSILPIDPDGAVLFYSFEGSDDFERASLRPGAVPGEWITEIPDPGEGTTVRYYWLFTNVAGDPTIVPENAPATTYSFYVGRDMVAPLIVHHAPTALARDASRLHLRAQIADNSQRLGDVRVEYRVGGGSLLTAPMTSRADDGLPPPPASGASSPFTTYDVALDLSGLGGAETFTYRILADDRALVPNTGELPQDDFFRIPVRRGWSRDFEADPGAAESTGDWEWGESNPAYTWSGTKLWATNLDGAYRDLTTSHLVFGPFDLSDFARARFQFHHRYRFEEVYDGADIQVRVDGTEIWAAANPSPAYNFGHLDALDGPGFSGASPGWQEVVVPLDYYLGQQVFIRLRAASDIGLADLGWYVDDVELLEAQAYIDPRELQAQGGMDQRVELSWRTPLGVDLSSTRWLGFHVYRRERGASPRSEVRLTEDPLRAFQFADTEVVNGTTYVYRVVTVYDDGESRGIEAEGRPFAASIGIDVAAIGMNVTGYTPEARGFVVTNQGSGLLDFDVFLVEPDAALDAAVASHALTQTPGDPVLVFTDPSEGDAVADIQALRIEEWSADGTPMVRFHLDGVWTDPRTTWGGMLVLDTDRNLATSQGDFELPWGGMTNMGFEYGVLFGNLPAQVGIGPVPAVFFDAERTFLQVLADVDLSPGGTISFSVPLNWIGGGGEIQTQVVVGPRLDRPASDYLPDVPEPARWFRRAPRHGQAIGNVRGRIDVVFDAPHAPSGTYRTDLIIRSNDRVRPEVRLPVTVQVDRNTPPPSLLAQSFVPALTGTDVSFTPSPALPVREAGIERENPDGSWRRLDDGTLAPDGSGTYRYRDAAVRQGRVYRYRFPIVFQNDEQFAYGPFEVIFAPQAPPLVAATSNSRARGIEITFDLDDALVLAQGSVERRVKSTPPGNWSQLATGIAAGEGNVFRHLDDASEPGVLYEYQLVARTADGVELEYGPLAALWESPYPTELPALAFASSSEGLEISFQVPPVFDPLVGVWLDRRQIGEEEFVALFDDPLVPGEDGLIRYFDPWSTPFQHGVEPGAEYQYRIRIEIAGDDVEYVHPAVFIPPTPTSLRLLPPRPNPFQGQVVVRFDLPSPLTVRLELFDVSGRRRAVLAEGARPAGSQQVVWDGTDEQGEPLGSGVYWLRMETEAGSQTVRLLRTK